MKKIKWLLERHRKAKRHIQQRYEIISEAKTISNALILNEIY